MDDIQIGDLVQVNIVARIVDKYGRTSLTIDYLGHRFTIHSQEVVGVVEPAIHKAAKKQEVK